MKKILALALALCMILGVAACGNNSDQNSSKTEDNSAAGNVSSEGDASTVSTDGKTLKVGFIFLHDENSTYDLNFINAAKAACEATGAEIVMKTNIPESNACYEAAADLADAGCDIVFADSFGHEPFIAQAAQEFPNVQFCHATGTTAHTAGIANLHNAFASIYEGRYLAGIAAGLKLNEMIAAGQFKAEEAKIGYVGAYTYAEVISGYTSFFLGVRSVCPTVTMDVKFTGSWYDEGKEKEAAEALIKGGCKLISQHADSMGAPTACEVAKVPNVSYNGSTAAACPNTFIVSSRIDWTPYMTYMLNCVKEGKTIDADWCKGLEDGAVKLTELGTAAAEGTQEAIDAAKAKMADGSLHVFDINTFTVDGKKLESYMADVNTDPAYEKDTEVVADGYFHESEYRSAPYFDVQIDGIKLLDTAF